MIQTYNYTCNILRQIIQAMNLFNEVMKAAKNSTINMYNNNMNGSGGQDDKLRGQLHVCTYTDDTKFVIEKAIKQVFHVYPFFETDILSFKQNNQQKRFLELKGILEIQVRGKMCKVDYNMMLPNGYPKKAPYVRIVNRNPDFIVDDFYKHVQSPSDPKSYILNDKLNQVRNWDNSKSLVNVIIESYDLMRNKFPFAKANSKNSVFNNPNMGGGWGSNNINNSPWNQLNNNNQPSQDIYSNNQGYNNYVNGGNSGGFGSNGNYGNNNYGNNNMGGGYNQGNKPPIPFNTNNVTQTIASGQKFAGTSRKSLQKIKIEHTKALESVQALDILKYSLQSEENYLRKENIQMNNFLVANENNQSTQDLAKLVRPADELSEQILDLLASIKARQDCTAQLDKKFNDGDLNLQELMKHLRRMEQSKFQEKVLLAKCINVAQKY